jgi:outer membrane autotransporter protein
MTAGIAANYTRPRADFVNQSSKVRGHSLQLGGFAGYALGPLFAQAHVGYGKDRHKIQRTGVVDNLTARADGSHVLAGAKAGFLMPVGSVRVGPVVALDYARAKVDGYTEAGDAALALNVGSQRYKSLTGDVGLEMRGDFAGGGVAFRPFVSASLEKDLEGDGRLATYAQVSASTIVNRFNIAERDKGVYTRLSAGGSAAIAGTVSINAFISSTLGKNQGNETSGHAGLSIGF